MPCISIALPVVVRFSGTKIEKLRAAVAAAIEENVPEFADDAQRWPIQDYCDDEEIGPMFTMEFAGRVLKVSYRPAQAIWWVELGEGIEPPPAESAKRRKGGAGGKDRVARPRPGKPRRRHSGDGVASTAIRTTHTARPLHQRVAIFHRFVVEPKHHISAAQGRSHIISAIQAHLWNMHNLDKIESIPLAVRRLLRWARCASFVRTFMAFVRVCSRHTARATAAMLSRVFTTPDTERQLICDAIAPFRYVPRLVRTVSKNALQAHVIDIGCQVKISTWTRISGAETLLTYKRARENARETNNRLQVI